MWTPKKPSNKTGMCLGFPVKVNQNPILMVNPDSLMVNPWMLTVKNRQNNAEIQKSQNFCYLNPPFSISFGDVSPISSKAIAAVFWEGTHLRRTLGFYGFLVSPDGFRESDEPQNMGIPSRSGPPSRWGFLWSHRSHDEGKPTSTDHPWWHGAASEMNNLLVLSP